MPSIALITNSLFYPHIKGGEQLSTMTLLRELSQIGWKVTIISRSRPQNPLVAVGRSGAESMMASQALSYHLSNNEFQKKTLDGMTFLNHFFSEDDLEEACVEYFSKHEKPDCILGIDTTAGANYQALSWEIAESLKVPCFVILRSVSWPEREDYFFRHPRVHFAANSSFTAQEFKRKYSKEIPVIYPFIKREDYLLDSFRPKLNEGFVTFINPLRIKGAKVVKHLVEQNPAMNFYVIPSAWGWPHTEEIRANLKLFKTFKNVVIPAFRDDIKPIIYSTRLLLVPSIFEETFGRVVNEFQMNGVPVLASESGNLPETVGDGGIIVKRGSLMSDFNIALGDILSSELRYAELSQRAQIHATQEKFSLPHQIETFLYWIMSSA